MKTLQELIAKAQRGPLDKGVKPFLKGIRNCKLKSFTSCSGLRKEHSYPETPFICFSGHNQRLAKSMKKAGWKPYITSANATIIDMTCAKTSYKVSDKAKMVKWKKLEEQIKRDFSC